jgi:AcrR family transcriptional regulator
MDRRGRRRQETIDEIVAIAEQLMDEGGVNALSLSEIARRLGVKPPSIYKYFDSLMAIFDELFHRGQQSHLEAIREALADAEPGFPAVLSALEAAGRWAIDHPSLAQLMFFRPVPGFQPSPEAMAPSEEMVGLLRQGFADAAAAKQLDPAHVDDAMWVTSVLVSGMIGQSLANEPGVPWGEGRFSQLLPKLLETIPALYPPKRK